MPRDSVQTHSGNVPDVGHDKLAVKRMSWMGPQKSQSCLVTFDNEKRIHAAGTARANRAKVMDAIRMQLSRVNDMLEQSKSPARDGSTPNGSGSAIDESADNSNNNNNSARALTYDPKQLVSYLDGTSHGRFTVTAYNTYVRAKMQSILERHPPSSTWPRMPLESEFVIPDISEGVGITPSNVTSAPTWRDMLGGRGTVGYNTRAAACAKELLQYEQFRGVNFGERFTDKKHAVPVAAGSSSATANAVGVESPCSPGTPASPPPTPVYTTNAATTATGSSAAAPTAANPAVVPAAAVEQKSEIAAAPADADRQ